MMTRTHPMAEEYLRRLDRAAAALPHAQRVELLGEIRSHLVTGMPPDPTEDEVRKMLDDLGPPSEIVAAAQPDRPVVRRGAREVVGLLLVVTGFPLLLGWFIGAGLLISSSLWTLRQKLLGLLVAPGGYLLTLGLLVAIPGARSSPFCGTGLWPATRARCVPPTGPSHWLAGIPLLISALAPLFVAGYLYRAAGRAARRSAGR